MRNYKIIIFNNILLRWLELFFIMVLFPVIIIIFNFQKFVIPIVIIASLISYFYLKKKHYKFKPLIVIQKKQIKDIFIRFLLICFLTMLFSYLYLSKTFFIFPYYNFGLWLLFITIYPFISAFPQELFFRAFFFERYSFLFTNKNYLILTNGLIFAITHSIYLNFFVLILTFIGGIILAKNYYYNKSIFLVTVEHSLLGNFIFTIGLGHHFEYSNIKYIYSIL